MTITLYYLKAFTSQPTKLTKSLVIFISFISLIPIMACTPTSTPEATSQPTITPAPTITPQPTMVDSATLPPNKPAIQAEVISVKVTGNPNAYQFAVEISSPDTGCDQYADWWEVLDAEGNLLYRRILAHSHVTEQPFTRSGGPVNISAEQQVTVRGHMHPAGYGNLVMQGSVESGFTPTDLDPTFGASVAEQSPLPTGCAW